MPTLRSVSKVSRGSPLSMGPGLSDPQCTHTGGVLRRGLVSGSKETGGTTDCKRFTEIVWNKCILGAIRGTGLVG